MFARPRGYGSLNEPERSSLGHIFLKVSTGYEGSETDSVLQRMNDLAHFAADVLGDKYKIFDIIPFRTSFSLLREDAYPTRFTFSLLGTDVCAHNRAEVETWRAMEEEPPFDRPVNGLSDAGKPGRVRDVERLLGQGGGDGEGGGRG